MASLYRSALVLGLLAVVSAPVAAFAGDENQVYSSSSSSARVIQYDPNSSEDIYETYDNSGQANQQHARNWGNDRQESEYRRNNGDNGRHRSRQRRNRRNQYRSSQNSNYTYNRFGQPTGVYNRQSTETRPQIIYRPSTTQQGTNCVNSRFGRVCN